MSSSFLEIFKLIISSFLHYFLLSLFLVSVPSLPNTSLVQGSMSTALYLVCLPIHFLDSLLLLAHFFFDC